MLLGLHQVFVRGRVGVKYCSVSASYCRFYSKVPPPEDCKKKPVQCLGEPPPLQPKCPKSPEEVCQQGTLKVAPLPKECKADVSAAPVYDKTCKRPYTNPCLPDTSKTCKCDMVPQPCLAPCQRKKKKICLGEPDCAYERKIDWGLRIRQVLLGVGAIVGGLILYRIYYGEKPELKIQMARDRRFVRPMEIIKIPEASGDIPDKVDYLLIGGGTASYAAQKAIRFINKDAKILIVSNSPPFKPAMRPPLSDWLWKEKDRDKALDLEFKFHDGKYHKLYFEPDNYYIPVPQLKNEKAKGVGVAQGWTIKKLNAQKKVAVLDDGKKIQYNACLLATGGRPKIMKPFDEEDPKVQERITFYRNSFDFQELEELVEEGLECIAVVGGGLLGTELAAALKERTKETGTRIVNIVKSSGNLKKILPSYLSKRISDILDQRGIHVLLDTMVEDIAKEGKGIRLYVTGDRCVNADHVVVATGIDPITDLAKDSCLEIDPVNGGFLVNSEMQSMTGVYAAGDCASFYDCNLGRRREEHHYHAIATGKLAGENMAGRNNRLNVQPTFWCHLAPDYEIEAVGIVDTKYPTVGVFPKSQEEPVKTAEDDDDDNDGEEESQAEVSNLANVNHKINHREKFKKPTYMDGSSSDRVTRNAKPAYLAGKPKDEKSKENDSKTSDKNAKIKEKDPKSKEAKPMDAKGEDGKVKVDDLDNPIGNDGKGDVGLDPKSPYDRVEDDTDLDNTLANQEFEKGVIYYLNDKQEIIGVLTLNLPGKMGMAQDLIKQKKTYDDIDEVTKTFDLHHKDTRKKPSKLGHSSNSKKDPKMISDAGLFG